MLTTKPLKPLKPLSQPSGSNRIVLNNDLTSENLLIKYFITLACNNRCPYCFMLPQLNNRYKWNHEIFDIFCEKFNEYLPTAKGAKSVTLELLGGDPFCIKEITNLNRLNINEGYQSGVLKKVLFYSNVNFKPEAFKKIVNQLNFKFRVYPSIHTVSNLEHVKENILYLNNNDMIEECIFVLDESSLHIFDEFMAFFKDNNVKYVLELVREDSTIIASDKIKKIFYDHYQDKKSNFKINNTFFTESEMVKWDLFRIARYFYVKCFTSELEIDYYGNICMACEYPYTSHIRNGFNIKPIMCHGYTCDCCYKQYKVLQAPKPNPNPKEQQIIDFVINKGKQ